MRSVAIAERFGGWRRGRSEGSLWENVWESFERRERFGMEIGYCNIIIIVGKIAGGGGVQGGAAGEGDKACY
jgi:hypothetical protein